MTRNTTFVTTTYTRDFPWWNIEIDKYMTVSDLFHCAELFSVMYWFLVSISVEGDFLYPDDRFVPTGVKLIEEEDGRWVTTNVKYMFTPQDKKHLNKMLSEYLTANMFKPEF